jgi:metal-responsive CopG/Arc/MetJ family transcriptional regulator
MASKISLKLPSELFERAATAAGKAGYSSVEEFIEHAVEKALAGLESADPESEVYKSLRGLGYIE